MTTAEAVLERLREAGLTDETALEALNGLSDQGGSVDEIIERILLGRYSDPVKPDLVKHRVKPKVKAYFESQEVLEPELPQRTRDYLAHGAPPGQRNNELFEAACQLRDAVIVGG